MGLSAILFLSSTLYTAIAVYYGSFQLIGLIAGSAVPFDETSVWPELIVNSCFVVNTWLADAFILYRCYVIWMGNKFAIALPALLYLASIGTSIAYLWAAGRPQTLGNSQTVEAFTIPYWTCSVALTVVSSLLIVARLLQLRRSLIAALGEHRGAPYLTMVSMTVESATLYSIFGVIALGLFTANNEIQNIFIPMLGLVQVIAPNLIINRIIRGISFTDENYTLNVESTIQFTRNYPSSHRGTLEEVESQPNGDSSSKIMKMKEHSSPVSSSVAV
ncbi:hypothetical protein F5I97DRAFT_1898918 [Phlebopus sp. FC_14]|nr:hypothetical protein F5I97DRAFT_1898918 [Phlebopus sp. FC_14]